MRVLENIKPCLYLKILKNKKEKVIQYIFLYNMKFETVEKNCNNQNQNHWPWSLNVIILLWQVIAYWCNTITMTFDFIFIYKYHVVEVNLRLLLEDAKHYIFVVLNYLGSYSNMGFTILYYTCAGFVFALHNHTKQIWSHAIIPC